MSINSALIRSDVLSGFTSVTEQSNPQKRRGVSSQAKRYLFGTLITIFYVTDIFAVKTGTRFKHPVLKIWTVSRLTR